MIRTRITGLAVVSLTAAVLTALPSATQPAWADSETPFVLSGVRGLVVDDLSQRVFIAGTTGSEGLVVATFGGSIIRTVPGLDGPAALARFGSPLYVGSEADQDIVVLSPVTLDEVDRYEVDVPCVRSLAFLGTNTLWFLYGCNPAVDGKLGSVDTSTGVVTLDQLTTSGEHLVVDARQAQTARLVVLHDDAVQVLDVTEGTPSEVTSWSIAGGGCRDAALLNQANLVVVACTSLVGHYMFDTVDGRPRGAFGSDVNPNAVAGDEPCCVATGRRVVDSSTPDITLYGANPDRTQRLSRPGGSLVDAALRWSGSTLFAVTRTGDAAQPFLFHVIEDANLERASIELDLPQSLPINGPSTLTGRLTGNGSGIPGAVLTVERTTSAGTTTLPDVVTDSEGRFSFSDIPGAPGQVTYAASFAGNATHAATTASASTLVAALPWDINGDGFAELVTGATLEDLGTITNAGIFHVLAGSAGGAVAAGSKAYHQNTAGVPDAAQSGDQFGYTQTSGDFNADGYADVAVSANAEDLDTVKNSGLVHVFYGSASGLRTDNSRTFSLWSTIYGPRSNAYFGDSLAAGDFDGDGDSDLAIGADGFGRVFVVQGSSIGLSDEMAVFRQGAGGVPGIHRNNDLFGNALAAGDANGDGRDDLAIGAIWDWDDRGWSTGSVTVLYGTPSGLSGSGAQRWSKDSPGIAGAPAHFGSNDWPDSFGYQVSLGDLDGDGFADLAASAPGAPVTYASRKRQDAGTLNIIYGSASRLTSSGNRLLTQASTGMPDSPEGNDHLGLTLSAGDANADGKAELAVYIGRDEGVTVIRGAARNLAISGAVHWTQNSPGVHDVTETQDDFGGSLRFAYYRGGLYAGLAVGNSTENNGKGAVEMLYGSSSGLTSTGAQFFTQDTPGVPDVAQTGDWFGSFF